jgi:EmrB/QacA subfamily drug resistance transporter
MYEKKKEVKHGKFETASIAEVNPSTPDFVPDVSSTNILPREQLPDASSAISTAATIDVEAANKWIILTLAALSTFMTTLDGSIVNIGLPAISQTFHVGVSGPIEWVIIGYLVIIASVLLTCGRLADMIGRKPILMLGLAIFVVGSALCGMASSLLLLILARLFQGLGGALIFAVNIAMITSTFPSKERGLALGLNAVVASLGVSAGPTIGGIITQLLTWRWIFYVNVPVGIIVLLAAFYFYKEKHERGIGRFDPVGAVLLGISLALITLALSFGEEWSWFSLATLSSLISGLLLLGVAVYIEQHIEFPILDMQLLRNRVFTFANITLMFAMMALFAPGFIMPFYFEQLRGFSTIETGLLLTPLSLMLAVVAPVSGTLADRFGSRWLSPIGLGVTCFGLFLVSQISLDSPLWDILLRLAIVGLGQGIFQSPNTRTMMGAAPRESQGEASGLLATGRVIGQSLSVALAGTIFIGLGGAVAGNLLSTQAGNLSPERVSSLQAMFINGFHASLLICALFAAIGIFTAIARGKLR